MELPLIQLLSPKSLGIILDIPQSLTLNIESIQVLWAQPLNICPESKRFSQPHLQQPTILSPARFCRSLLVSLPPWLPLLRQRPESNLASLAERNLLGAVSVAYSNSGKAEETNTSLTPN